jgi:hypothetical protein
VDRTAVEVGTASRSPLEGAPARAVAETGEGAQLRLPTPDEIRAQDIFNNCAVRTGVSGVMGTGPCFVFADFCGCGCQRA